MMRLALLALAGCTASAAPADQVQRLVTIPAWDVAITANRITVIDDGFASLTSFAATTGKRAWTRKLAPQDRGRHMLLVNGASLIAWFADTAQVLDAATGKLAGAPYATVMNGGGCWLDVQEGACARRCPCSFQIADCTTGALRGKSFHLEEIDESDADGGHSSPGPQCPGDSGWLHGRVGNVALISAEDRAKGKSTSVLAGIDVVTGKQVWSRPGETVPSTSVHSPDGKTCYFATYRDAITVVDCATGKQLWIATPAKVADAQLVAFVPGRGVYRLAGGIGTLFAERTGKVVWTATPGMTTLAWPKGAPLAVDSVRATTQVAILDPATGKPLATIPLAAGSSVHLDPGGGFAITSAAGITAYDDVGTATGTSNVAATGLVFGRTLVVADTQRELVVLERGTLRERGRLPGKVDSVHVEGPLGARRFTALTYDGKTIGSLALYKVD